MDRESFVDEADEDIPIDLLENMRGRSTRDHCSDEAVGREIARRFVFFWLKNGGKIRKK